MRSLCHHHHRVSLNLTYIPFSSLIVLSLVIEVEGHEVLLRAHGPAAAWQVHDGGRRSFQPSFLPPNHHPAKEDDAQDVAFPVIQGCGLAPRSLPTNPSLNPSPRHANRRPSPPPRNLLWRLLLHDTAKAKRLACRDRRRHRHVTLRGGRDRGVVQCCGGVRLSG